VRFGPHFTASIYRRF